nr:alpha/beta hydrolase [uncultured Roseococcus sp.]
MAKSVTVHFATNREEKGTKNEVTGFGPGLNRLSPILLRYGAAEMVPEPGKGVAYRVGELRIAAESLPGVTAPESADRVLGSTSVFDGLRERLIANKADLLLLLHGFACTFEEALSNAAELKTKWSTKEKPLEVAVFCWPANGTLKPLLDYVSDRDDGRLSAKAVSRSLRRFIDYMREVAPDQRCDAGVHLVAHSMGNYVLRNALQALLSDLGGRTLPRIFKNIFLMAADEDSDCFEDTEKLARLSELAEAIQVYFARNDRALVISDLTKANPDRLGATGPRTLTNLPQKVTLVDCTDISATSPVSDLNHQYYRKGAEAIRDIKYVLAGWRPEDIRGRSWVPARYCFRIQKSGA